MREGLSVSRVSRVARGHTTTYVPAPGGKRTVFFCTRSGVGLLSILILTSVAACEHGPSVANNGMVIT